MKETVLLRRKVDGDYHHSKCIHGSSHSNRRREERLRGEEVREMERKHPKHFRRIGEVSVEFFEKRDMSGGKGLGFGVGMGERWRGVVIGRSYVRENRVTGELILDDNGFLKVT